jgi:hypothetical protein
MMPAREDVYLRRRSGPVAIQISFAIEKNGQSQQRVTVTCDSCRAVPEWALLKLSKGLKEKKTTGRLGQARGVVKET